MGNSALVLLMVAGPTEALPIPFIQKERTESAWTMPRHDKGAVVRVSREDIAEAFGGIDGLTEEQIDHRGRA